MRLATTCLTVRKDGSVVALEDGLDEPERTLIIDERLLNIALKDLIIRELSVLRRPINVLLDNNGSRHRIRRNNRRAIYKQLSDLAQPGVLLLLFSLEFMGLTRTMTFTVSSRLAAMILFN